MPLKVKVAYGVVLAVLLSIFIAVVGFIISQWEWMGPIVAFGLFLIVVVWTGAWALNTILEYENKDQQP